MKYNVRQNITYNSIHNYIHTLLIEHSQKVVIRGQAGSWKQPKQLVNQVNNVTLPVRDDECTYSQSFHLTEGLQSMRSGQMSTVLQSFQDSVECLQVWLHFLLTHLLQQILVPMQTEHYYWPRRAGLHTDPELTVIRSHLSLYFSLTSGAAEMRELNVWTSTENTHFGLLLTSNKTLWLIERISAFDTAT